MTDRQHGRTTRLKRWLAKKFVGALLIGARPNLTEASEPIGGEIHPQSLHLPKEDWVTEMDVKYGDDQYRLVERNGELRLERVDND